LSRLASGWWLAAEEEMLHDGGICREHDSNPILRWSILPLGQHECHNIASGRQTRTVVIPVGVARDAYVSDHDGDSGRWRATRQIDHRDSDTTVALSYSPYPK
jgi:hypothetical protein